VTGVVTSQAASVARAGGSNKVSNLSTSRVKRARAPFERMAFPGAVLGRGGAMANRSGSQRE